MKTIVFVSLLIFSFASLAMADAYVVANCEGDSVHFYMGYTGGFDTPQYLNMTARVLGSCDPPTRVNPVPFPYPESPSEIDFELMLPVYNSDRYVVYELYREDSDGNIFEVFNLGDLHSFSYSACTGDAVFARGWLTETNGEVVLDVCDGFCWDGSWNLDFSNTTPGWEALVGSGQLVNLYGDTHLDFAMYDFEVSRVEVETSGDGCSAVEESSSSWGSLKAAFR